MSEQPAQLFSMDKPSPAATRRPMDAQLRITLGHQLQLVECFLERTAVSSISRKLCLRAQQQKFSATFCLWCRINRRPTPLVKYHHSFSFLTYPARRSLSVLSALVSRNHDMERLVESLTIDVLLSMCVRRWGRASLVQMCSGLKDAGFFFLLVKYNEWILTLKQVEHLQKGWAT